jgi:hypothetical protein
MPIIAVTDSSPAGHIVAETQWRTHQLWDQLFRAAQRIGGSSVAEKNIVPLAFHSTSRLKRALLSC